MKNRQRRWMLDGLKHLGAPIVFAQLVSLIFAVDGLDWSSPGQHVETFAGAMSVTRGEWQVGRKATPLDIEIDPVGMDLTTDQGFANALFQVANLEPGSASMSAPVCSTFVFMSFGSRLRSKLNPLGKVDLECVRVGNLLAARACVLCLLCACGLVGVGAAGQLHTGVLANLSRHGENDPMQAPSHLHEPLRRPYKEADLPLFQ
ncbi:unnamed protein product [Durusdinium trenchii]|uniref:Uncharacterized protein n=1 Tax=Durusdinium trenchii TaxID=1381693 RepID=A0ABP0LPD7_9DINO